MVWNFEQLLMDARQELEGIKTAKALEEFRVKYLGKKGVIQQVYASLAQASAEEKPLIGKQANIFKNEVSGLFEQRKKDVEGLEKQQHRRILDVSLPGVSQPVGVRHVLNQTIDQICGIFEGFGFVIEEGPEVETEFHNFDALNIPKDHPSRDGFDTFYVDEKDPDDKKLNQLLRSQTSPVQIRVMKAHTPPLAVVVPGRVYRPDAVDASHSFMFHQIEGLLVDKHVRFSDLKGLIEAFLKRLFGEEITMRFRPHFFPFTEPSAEVDVSCYICKGKGCSACKRTGWIEVMGCGMVHPKVFEAAGYPKGKYTGLAFGLGVERLTMLKYGIHDIRLFFENDLRFLKQF
ncbi:MAG TPA: phenylalanine--tRNA ligase subunit alpha [Candidatus Omnitrophota bacterium]|jgi:phenylalanyl-tRNA synthetase alpha chain|nr:phenylalanine--tRNA ligase subunit alpha [Candidatus Omnitrophota bacterium]HSA30377.1 phenylalanine--tRNA ligase subunit alpha [Candidatus Omnitrophota bacterium]